VPLPPANTPVVPASHRQ